LVPIDHQMHHRTQLPIGHCARWWH
jgi:hypothetical protein